MKTKSSRFILVLAAVVALAIAAPAQSDTFVIGGAVYSDLANPMTTGLEGVTVTVVGTGGTFSAQTQGTMGLWQINDVPEDTYTVTPLKTGTAFEHVEAGVSDGQPDLTITVNAESQAANQSIQFLVQASGPQYVLTATVIGAHGTVTPSTGTYAENTVVVLTAVPDVGYAVLTWTGIDDPNSEGNTAAVTMTSNRTVTVEFIELGEDSFTVGGAIYTDLANPMTSGLPGVTVNITDETGPYYYVATTNGAQGIWQIDLPLETYTVDPVLQGYTFTYIANGLPDDPPPITITVHPANQAENQSIQFLASPQYKLTTAVVGNEGGGIAPATGFQDPGSTVNLTATPASGWQVLQWTGIDPGSDADDPSKATVTMISSKTVTVQFQQPDFVIDGPIEIDPALPPYRGTFTAKVKVKNQGSVSGNAGCLDVWLDKSSTASCGQSDNRSVLIGELAPGAAKTATFSSLPADSPGLKTFRAFIDSHCDTAESNEANNQASQGYAIEILPDTIYLNKCKLKCGKNNPYKGLFNIKGTSLDLSAPDLLASDDIVITIYNQNAGTVAYGPRTFSRSSGTYKPKNAKYTRKGLPKVNFDACVKSLPRRRC